MFTECKITEIFFMADEFCKFFDSTVKKYSVLNHFNKMASGTYSLWTFRARRSVASAERPATPSTTIIICLMLKQEWPRPGA